MTSITRKSLGGVKIEGLDSARKKLTLNGIDTILLAMPNAPFEVRERIFDLLAETPVKVKSIQILRALLLARQILPNYVISISLTCSAEVLPNLIRN